MIRLISVFLLVTLTTIGTGCRPHNHFDHYSVNQADKHVLLEEHNKIRQSRGLGTFEPDSRLEAAAQRHAEWMARHEKLSHTGEAGSNVSNRVSGGYRCLAENIAYGFKTENQVMQGWMNSYGHRRNILNKDLKHIGIGISESRSGVIFWCVVFGC